MKIYHKLSIFVFILLLLDQCLKIWIKTNMVLGESITVFDDWFKILFVENNGMAFGMEFGGEWGKLSLSLFRLVAIAGILWYIVKLIKEKTPQKIVYSFALIFAGAIGNIIDSLFYGMIFSDSYGRVASFLPEEGGYASFLHGKVVDMFYFPLIEGTLPNGEPFVFFRPVFNLADSYISVGVALLILFSLLGHWEQNKDKVTDNITDNI